MFIRKEICIVNGVGLEQVAPISKDRPEHTMLVHLSSRTAVEASPEIDSRYRSRGSGRLAVFRPQDLRSLCLQLEEILNSDES